jgi:succinate dehydrogenase/fumarate reductase-like Fe-S protein
VVVKNREDKGLISDLAEIFDNLRKFKMKLNPEKCTREKVSTITKMAPPESIHDVQKLTGCMTALSRFISQLGVKRLSFFKLME